MNHRCFTGVLVALVFAGASIASPEIPRFAIYLVDFVENESAPVLERQVDDDNHKSVFVTQEYALVTAVKQDPPILTDSDIMEYCWATQRIQLTADGARRWNSLGGYQTPLTGNPIQIYVDGEPQYAALIWNPASSLSCKLPQFWGMTLENRLIVTGRSVSAAGDTILGVTYDEQVKQVMSELGKLTENCRVE